MALVVEDGTGRAEADGYVSQEYFEQYCLDRGLAIPAGLDPEDVPAAIRRGSEAIDLLFGTRWPGRRLNPLQALDWPRLGVFVEGLALPASPLPRRLKMAAAEASWREVSSPGVLVPDRDASAVVTSESIGPISVSYAVSSSSSSSSPAVVFAAVENLLSQLLRDASGTDGVGVYYLSRA